VREPVIDPAAGPAPSLRLRLFWTACAFIPAALLLGATHYLTLDVAPIPLLWVLPLSVYLGTFILAFARPSPVRVPALSRWMAVLAVALSLALLARVRDPVWVVVLLHVCVLAVAGLLCHGRLAAARPEARSLTEFYMFVAIGGVLGGAFAALAGPRLFDDLIEYPIAIVLACMLRVGRTPDEHIAPDDHHTLRRNATSRVLDVALPAALALFMLAVWLGGEELAEGPFVLFSAIVPAIACFFLSPRPLRFALGVAVLLFFAYSTQVDRGEFLHAERTFFGVHRVTRDPADRYTVLRHGSTIHGVQSTDPARATEPLGYYHVGGPGGQVLRSLAERSPESRIAFVGLGAGALAVPRQRLTLYEIDRAVVDIAEDTRWFTYLANSPAPYHVVVADGRIALARTEERYDLIVLDAFSSAAVPIHLLTREAVALYLERLAPDGAPLFHVSNQHLELAPVLARIAADLGLAALERIDSGPVDEEGVRFGSHLGAVGAAARPFCPLRRLSLALPAPRRGCRALDGRLLQRPLRAPRALTPRLGARRASLGGSGAPAYVYPFAEAGRGFDDGHTMTAIR